MKATTLLNIDKEASRFLTVSDDLKNTLAEIEAIGADESKEYQFNETVEKGNLHDKFSLIQFSTKIEDAEFRGAIYHIMTTTGEYKSTGETITEKRLGIVYTEFTRAI